MHADTKGGRFQPDSEVVDAAVDVFRLLAEATRIRIVLALRDGELSVNQLAETVNRSAAAVSQHLAKLRGGRLVKSRNEGNRIFYRLTDEHATRLVVESLLQAEHAVQENPSHHA